MEKNKVSKLELKHSLKESLDKNFIAIDCVENWIHKVKDSLAYNENDFSLKEDLEVLEYIQFCLLYLDKQYIKSYKKLGGKI